MDLLKSKLMSITTRRTGLFTITQDRGKKNRIVSITLSLDGQVYYANFTGIHKRTSSFVCYVRSSTRKWKLEFYPEAEEVDIEEVSFEAKEQ